MTQPIATVNPLRLWVLWAALLALPGCALWSTDTSREAWPSDIPSRSTFEARYDHDENNRAVQSRDDYLKWVRRFYTGWRLHRNGWSDLKPDLLAEIESESERKRLAHELDEMGQDIAGEWAKESEDRKVRTKHLSIWGNAMRDAMAEGEVAEMIRRIQKDIDRLMERELAVSDITDNRYYAQDADDVFR